MAIEQLRTAVERRPVIDHARGVLMAAHRLTSEDAWKVLVSVSQHSNIKLRTVAVDIVANAPGGDVNGSYPRLIENALAKLKAE
ncbi:ANTAR domain-containing protein [Streptomyces albidus (ex Kaewkla and Franco 2022)]|uniref:ANTAR domain-containing protein n=1 Tax=Streptomyces albidus (ex Kaewkla and Franco 2022) TaxID=722709 RepID=UPI00281598DA|nr:ANTAR domain-containing protein [Streptomyces albidus (ex Kaewkla and Franco 2022)]